MQRHAPFAAILSLALSLPLAAEPAQMGRLSTGQAQANGPAGAENPAAAVRKALLPDAPFMELGPAAAGDITGSIPSPHRRELSAIAICEATGNKDGAAILAQGLRKFGVTRETIRRYIDSARLHDGLPGVLVAIPQAAPNSAATPRPEPNAAKPAAELELETHAPAGGHLLAGATLPFARPSSP
jgi:alkylhydroperoxidase/carboxymuconolactone decarboxylase family protein YurZ